MVFLRFIARGFDRFRTFCRLSWSLLRGYWLFRRTGVTPADATESVNAFHCLTDGRSSEFFSRVMRVCSRHRSLLVGDHRFGTRDLQHWVPELQREGVCVFPERWAPDACRRLREFALSELPDRSLKYFALRQGVDLQRLAEQPDVQALMTDPSVLTVAERYLGAKPVWTITELWWSALASENLATSLGESYRRHHRYHFEIEGLRAIAFYVYLSDVTELNSPFCYMTRSHRGKPQVLRSLRGVSSETLMQFYPAGRERRILGGTGTMFAADPAGYHRGEALVRGDRLMLSMVFTNSAFGKYNHRVRMNGGFLPEFVHAVRARPGTYGRFVPELRSSCATR